MNKTRMTKVVHALSMKRKDPYLSIMLPINECRPYNYKAKQKMVIFAREGLFTIVPFDLYVMFRKDADKVVNKYLEKLNKVFIL